MHDPGRRRSDEGDRQTAGEADLAGDGPDCRSFGERARVVRDDVARQLRHVQQNVGAAEGCEDEWFLRGGEIAEQLRLRSVQIDGSLVRRHPHEGVDDDRVGESGKPAYERVFGGRALIVDLNRGRRRKSLRQVGGHDPAGNTFAPAAPGVENIDLDDARFWRRTEREHIAFVAHESGFGLVNPLSVKKQIEGQITWFYNDAMHQASNVENGRIVADGPRDAVLDQLKRRGEPA